MKKISDKNHYIGQWTSVIGQNVIGFGYVNASGQLVFAWNTGKVQGITEYKLSEGDKPYVGRWSQINDPRWHPETIFFKAPLPKAEKEDDDEGKETKKG